MIYQVSSELILLNRLRNLAILEHEKTKFGCYLDIGLPLADILAIPNLARQSYLITDR
jgi:hypothetical protein